MITTLNKDLGPIPDKRRRKVKPPTQRVSVEFFDIFLSPAEPAFKKKQVGFTMNVALDNHLLSMTATCQQYDISASVAIGSDSLFTAYIKARQALIDKMRATGLCVDNMDFKNLGNISHEKKQKEKL